MYIPLIYTLSVEEQMWFADVSRDIAEQRLRKCNKVCTYIFTYIMEGS